MDILFWNPPGVTGHINDSHKNNADTLKKRVSGSYSKINIEYTEEELEDKYSDYFIFIDEGGDDRKSWELYLKHWEATISNLNTFRRRFVLLFNSDREIQNKMNNYAIAASAISPRGGHLIYGWVGNMHHSPFFMGIKEVIEQMKTGEVRNWPESLPTSENEFHYIGAHEKEPVDPFLVLVEYLELYEKFMKEKGLL